MKCKKVSFVNEEQAEFYVNKLQKTSKRKVKPVRGYLCEHCLMWHLTSIESVENMQLVYKDRQINNLKAKVLYLQIENEHLKRKLEQTDA